VVPPLAHLSTTCRLRWAVRRGLARPLQARLRVGILQLCHHIWGGAQDLPGDSKADRLVLWGSSWVPGCSLAARRALCLHLQEVFRAPSQVLPLGEAILVEIQVGLLQLAGCVNSR